MPFSAGIDYTRAAARRSSNTSPIPLRFRVTPTSTACPSIFPRSTACRRRFLAEPDHDAIFREQSYAGPLFPHGAEQGRADRLHAPRAHVGERSRLSPVGGAIQCRGLERLFRASP